MSQEKIGTLKERTVAGETLAASAEWVLSNGGYEVYGRTLHGWGDFGWRLRIFRVGDENLQLIQDLHPAAKRHILLSSEQQDKQLERQGIFNIPEETAAQES